MAPLHFSEMSYKQGRMRTRPLAKMVVIKDGNIECRYELSDNGEAYWSGFHTSRPSHMAVMPHISETVCPPEPRQDPEDPLSIDSLLNRKNEPRRKVKIPSIFQFQEGWLSVANPLTTPLCRIEIPC